MKTKTILQYETLILKIFIDVRENGAAYSRNLYKKGDAGKMHFRISIGGA